MGNRQESVPMRVCDCRLSEKRQSHKSKECQPLLKRRNLADNIVIFVIFRLKNTTINTQKNQELCYL
jgi:hypothetical protein